MKPAISEFSYGYALTDELVEKNRLKQLGAPSFPTQAQESKPGGGYDMKLPGMPVFLQFKRSDVLTRPTAKDWETFQSKYHRFHITASAVSNQHDLLLDLESKRNVVLYAAPRFDSSQELDDAYINGKVVARSIFFKPSDIGAISDSLEHSMSYGAGDFGLFRSEPKRVEATSLEGFFESRIENSIDGGSLGESRNIRDLLTETIDSYLSTHPESDGDGIERLRSVDDQQLPNRMNYIVRNLLGAQLLFL